MDSDQMKRIESLRESFSENALKLATVYRSQAVSMELLEKERAQKKKLQGEISKLQDQVNLLTTKNESWSDTLQQLRQQEEKKTSELKEQLQNFQEQVNQLKLQLKNNERVYQSELTKREKNTTSLIADAMQESVEVKRQLDSMAQQFMGIRKTFEKAGICLKSANQALKEKNEQMNAVAEENINLHHQLEMYQDASAKLGFSSLSEEEKDDIIAKLKSQVEELKRKDELKIYTEKIKETMDTFIQQEKTIAPGFNERLDKLVTLLEKTGLANIPSQTPQGDSVSQQNSGTPSHSTNDIFSAGNWATRFTTE